MTDSTTTDVDVVVIGAGPAGEVVAGRCAAGGLDVTIVERELAGGECSYWGCIPSKTLIRPGEIVAAARRVPGVRLDDADPIDVVAAFARRDEMVSEWDDEGQVTWITDSGVTFLRGAGRLVGERAVAVESAGGATTLTARRAVVMATGTRALIPPITGLHEASPWDNRTATGARQVPSRLLVLGGGPIGAELAQAFGRLGAAVTLVEAADRLLSREEPFAGDEVAAAFAAEGIDVRAGRKITEVRRDAAGGEVTGTLDDGTMVAADEILVAVGRHPATDDLGLDAVGLQPGKPIAVDRQLRAEGVPGGWLYAVGDCNGVALLTHMGKYQARLAADVILGRQVSDRADHGIVPRVTFTDPQVAAVGLTEAEARRQGLDVRVVSYATRDVAGASTIGRGVRGTSQLVVDEQHRTVVGATFTGPGVVELLHSATVAIAGDVTVDQLWHAVPSFPTLSEVWLRLLEAYGL